MEVITIEETASKTIMEKLDLIADYIMQTKKNNTLEDDWLDNYAVCELLKISTRTLQRLRANNTIEHVKMGGKVYFQVKEIKRILQENIIHRNLNDFEQAIKNGADAVLVGHLLIMGVTGMYPASLSRKFITKYLRAKYRYNGLVVTDDLKMRAIKFFYGPDTAVRKAFEAGNDIIVFRFNKDEEQRVLDKIESLVKTGKIKENRINKSVKRILKIKACKNNVHQIEQEDEEEGR